MLGDNPVPTGTWSFDKQSGTGVMGAVGLSLVDQSCAATQIFILPVVPLTVNLSIDVYIYDQYYQVEVKSAVQTAVDAYVRNTNSTVIAQLIALSGLMTEIEITPGVDYVNVKQFNRKQYIEPVSIGVANSTYSEVTGTNVTKEETFTIFFLTATTFTVEGSVSGLQANT